MANRFENIDTVTKADVVRDLSSDSVRYFADTKLGEGWRNYNAFGLVKFIRLGVGEAGRIVLGSTIDYGPEVDDGWGGMTRGAIKHIDLLDYARQSNLDIDAISSSIGDRVSIGAGGLMLDAGRARIINAEGVYTIRFGDYSIDFGSADEHGRKETAETAKSQLGDEFSVESTMHNIL